MELIKTGRKGQTGLNGSMGCLRTADTVSRTCMCIYYQHSNTLLVHKHTSIQFAGVSRFKSVVMRHGARSDDVNRASCDESMLKVANVEEKDIARTERPSFWQELLHGEVLRLALPALVVVLSDPLQTLVDSACLGRISTMQLAALGPNTAVFNSSFQLFTFLGIATANIVASNSLNKANLSVLEKNRRRDVAEMAASTSVYLGILFGIACCAILVAVGPLWLHSMGTDPQVFPFAQEYLKIRAFATPFVFVMNACQGICLGQQDTITPMIVCGIATLGNIIGDIVLIWGFHMGVRGAALATTCAQIGATFLILHKVWTKGKRPNAVGLRWKGLPDSGTLKTFATVGTTLIMRTAVGIMAYFSMTTAATRLGMTAAAAHQVAMQIFWFISFLPEPLSMAAQTLVAKERTDVDAARRWAKLLAVSGTMFGLILAAVAAAALTFAAPIFTQDAIVQGIVQSLAPYAALAMGICGLMMMMDGISIGSNVLAHLPIGVGAGFMATISLLWYSSKVHAGVSGVWWALCGFYGMRLAVHLIYYAITWPKNVFGEGRDMVRGAPRIDDDEPDSLLHKATA